MEARVLPRRFPSIAVSVLLPCTLVTARAEAAPGDLDPTFGTGGLVRRRLRRGAARDLPAL